jgi:hypothetical protein
MPPYDVLPVVLGMTLMLCTAGVLILRPLTKRLGDLIETRTRERQAQAQIGPQELDRLADVVGRLTDRIESLEERQDFSERLLASLERPEPKAHLQDRTQP